MQLTVTRQHGGHCFWTGIVLATWLSVATGIGHAQSPYFPNTTATYYSPYGQGAYGRYGVMTNQSYAFRQTPPGLFRPLSAAQFSYRTQNSGYNGNSYIENSGAGAYFNPLGY
jgi:hypothetical protein